MKRPGDELVRSWLHLSDSETFEAAWADKSCTVLARGCEWSIEWNDSGEVKLDGRYRDSWTWEYRRWLKRNEEVVTKEKVSIPIVKKGKKP